MSCTCKTMYENKQKKGKKINLQLGVTNFLHDTVADVDPLIELFKDNTWTFQNPQTKQKEKLSVFDVINSQICLQEKDFKVFPPSVLIHPDTGIF